MSSAMTWEPEASTAADIEQQQASELALQSLNSLREAAMALLREVESLRTIHQAYAAGGRDLQEKVQLYEAELIKSALQRTGGNQRRAAQLLGIKATTLNCKIKRYGISIIDEDDDAGPLV